MKRGLIVFVALGVIAVLVLGGLAWSKRNDAESSRRQTARAQSEQQRLDNQTRTTKHAAAEDDVTVDAIGSSIESISGHLDVYKRVLGSAAGPRQELIAAVNNTLRQGELTPTQRAEIERLHQALLGDSSLIDNAYDALANTPGELAKAAK